MPLGTRMQLWWQPIAPASTLLGFALVGNVPDDSYLAFGPAARGATDRLMGGADAAAGGVDAASGVAWAGARYGRVHGQV